MSSRSIPTSVPPAPFPQAEIEALFTGPIHAFETPFQGGYTSVWIASAQRGRFVLKTARAPEGQAALLREGVILNALAAYRPRVPAFYGRAAARNENGPPHYFALSCIEGRTLAEAVGDLADSDALAEHKVADKVRALLHASGVFLREIHGWRPGSPYAADVPVPPDWLGAAVAGAAERAAGNEDVVITNPYSAYCGARTGDVYADAARAYKNGAFGPTRLVWGHGDWCLPNILVATDGKTLAGAVDWSAGGWADARADLATGLRSIRRNLTGKSAPGDLATYADAFLSGYGYREGPQSLAPFEALYNL